MQKNGDLVAFGANFAGFLVHALETYPNLQLRRLSCVGYDESCNYTIVYEYHRFSAARVVFLTENVRFSSLCTRIMLDFDACYA